MENHFHIVSKVHILPNLILKNSKKDSTVDNDINEFIEYYIISGLKILEL